jgi:adenylate cyclase
MKNRIYSLLTGFVMTLILSGFSFLYLTHIQNKKAWDRPTPYLDIFETMDQRFNDLKFNFAVKKPSRSLPKNAVMIAVDDATLREVGRWPWNREIVTELLSNIMATDVRAIGLDIIFSEPEREAAHRDIRLGQLIEKNANKIVLGAYSNDMLKLLPYQDYCVNEAFLTSGGDQLVKFSNTSFVVDDQGGIYDDLQWNSIFKPIFKVVQQTTEKNYLLEIKKTKIEDLNFFQRNYLLAKKNKDVFDYCSTWLTAKDTILAQNEDQLAPIYQMEFVKKKNLAGLTFRQQIDKFKKSVSALPVPQYGEWQGNTDPIQAPALYTGSFVAYLDIDGYVRRYPLFYRSGNRLGTSFIPSLALQTYLSATGYRADVKIAKIGKKKVITAFSIKDPSQEPETLVQEIPVDAEGRLIINYYGPDSSLPQISAKDLFSDQPTIDVYSRVADKEGRVVLRAQSVNKKEYFKDKMAIVGVTAMAVYDLRNTPVAANYPGAEVHQTVLANLLTGKYITRIKNETIILPLGILFLGFLLTFCLSYMGPVYSVLCMLLSLVAFFWIDHWAFQNLHIMFSSVFLFLEIPTITFPILVFKYASEEKKKNEIRKMFAKYVSPSVVDELLKNVDNLKLGGKKQEMSVFFSDVRGFTEFSEKMDPQELSQFLNEYLTPMTEVVFKNKGTLDKYMGDGLMAFFGAPVPFDDHAYHACKCALESLQILKVLQAECARKNWPHIDIGIGINSGSMSVGNMGSKIVQSYTVIGDAVNLGSRLESANKEYGTKILISDMTHTALAGKLITREVDLVRVKGKKEPVKAFELLAEEADSKMKDWLEAYDKAYLHYQQQHFEVAKNQFSKILLNHPLDTVSKMYIQRCDEFIKNPPSSAWDGVYEMKAK